jgi:hypothetical protein
MKYLLDQPGIPGGDLDDLRDDLVEPGLAVRYRAGFKLPRGWVRERGG